MHTHSLRVKCSHSWMYVLLISAHVLDLSCVSSPAALAMGLCVAMIAFVRLPSLKVSCLLLSGLLIYDVFWVRCTAAANGTRSSSTNTTPPPLYQRPCFSHAITSVSGRLLSCGPTRRYVFSSVKDVGGEHWRRELQPQMRHINSRTGQPVSSSAKTKASLFMSCCLLPSPVTFLVLSLLWSVARAEHSKAATTWQL